jgi:hypothetical protein
LEKKQTGKRTGQERRRRNGVYPFPTGYLVHDIFFGNGLDKGTIIYLALHPEVGSINITP